VRRGTVMSKHKQQGPDTEIRAIASDHTPTVAYGGPGSQQLTLCSQSVDTQSFFHALVPRYMECVYTSHPIVSESELLECIDRRKSDNTAAAFAYAAIATTIHFTSADFMQMTESVRATELRQYVEWACDALGAQRPFSPLSVIKAMTHLFLANCLVAMGDRNTAFMHLRQAVSMTEVLLSRSESDPGYCGDSRLRRLYWLVYIHERYECISESHQTVLKPLPCAFMGGEDLSTNVSVGFRRLVRLFLLLDDTFLAFWSGTGTRAPITEDWIARRCEAFNEDEREAELEESQLSVAQRADLFITRHWLLALLWRIAMSHNLLRDLAPEVCFSLLFPIHVSKRLRQVLEQMPLEALLIHGVGIGQKLFELTDTVADVILHVSSTSTAIPGSTMEQLDNFLYLRNVLLGFSLLDATRKSIIEEKIARIVQIKASFETH